MLFWFLGAPCIYTCITYRVEEFLCGERPQRVRRVRSLVGFHDSVRVDVVLQLGDVTDTLQWETNGL